MVVALVGTNWFKVKRRLDELVSEFVSKHGDLALEKLDAEDVEYSQILGAVESLPFLASKKMVIVHNLSASKEAAEQLEQLIARAGDTTDLIMLESKVDKRGTYYKQLKKLKGFEEFNDPDARSLVDWLVREAKAGGATLVPADAQYLVDRVGANQTALAHELEKLVQYDPHVTKQTIELLTDQTPTSTVFNLIDSAFSGNLKAALKTYDEQRAQKVEPQAIHGMLVWQMNIVAACSAAGDKSSSVVAAETSLNPYVVGKSQTIARRMGRAKISQFLALLRDIDYTSKHQTYDYDQAMRYAIVSLAQN